MAVVINTNMSSLSASRNLASSQNSLARSVQRLSSGLRINSAKDDAAGLAISTRMTTQISGMNQAARNANDGISLLQTAEGVFETVSANLQRIRVLAVQAANATNSTSDREALQNEVSELIQEIDRVGKSAEFNNLKIFAETSSSVVGDEDQLAVIDGLQLGWLEQAERRLEEHYGIVADGVGLNIELTTFTDGENGVAARVGSQVPANGYGQNITLQIDMADFVPPNLPNGGDAPFYNDRIIAHEMAHAVMNRTTNYGDLVNNYLWFVEGTAEFIHGADERVFADGGSTAPGAANLVAEFNNGFSGSSADYSASYAATRFLHVQIQAGGGSGIRDIFDFYAANPLGTLAEAISSTNAYANADPNAGYAAFVADFTANGAAFIQGFDFANADTGAIGGLDVDGGPELTAESVIPTGGSRPVNDVLTGFVETYEDIGGLTTDSAREDVFQIGANIGQTISTQMGPLNAAALAITEVDIVEQAQRAIGQMDRALAYVNGERAKLGAQMARFETAIANLQTGAENITASRSRIEDADYAGETAELTRASIIQQSATAVLSQANLQPQIALRLLNS